MYRHGTQNIFLRLKSRAFVADNVGMATKLYTDETPRFLSKPDLQEMTETMLVFQLRLAIAECAARGIVLHAQRDVELLKDMHAIMPTRPTRQRPAL